MKNIKHFILALIAGIVALCAAGCSSSSSEPLGYFQKVYDKATLEKYISDMEGQGKTYAIIDFRSEADYKAGTYTTPSGVKAQWVGEATATDINNGNVCSWALAKATTNKGTSISKSTNLFVFVSARQADFETILPGKFSKEGWGKGNHIYGVMGGYEKIK